MRRETNENLTGIAQFERSAADLIHGISSILGLHYTPKLVPDGQNESNNLKITELDGTVRELSKQRVDLDITSLTVT